MWIRCRRRSWRRQSSGFKYRIPFLMAAIPLARAAPRREQNNYRHFFTVKERKGIENSTFVPFLPEINFPWSRQTHEKMKASVLRSFIFFAPSISFMAAGIALVVLICHHVCVRIVKWSFVVCLCHGNGGGGINRMGFYVMERLYGITVCTGMTFRPMMSNSCWFVLKRPRIFRMQVPQSVFHCVIFWGGRLAFAGIFLDIPSHVLSCKMTAE